METPICDFVRDYTERHMLRLHMPGHKGMPLLGMEAYDITEIDGADSLYEAAGIIRRSEENASHLFGADTFYSTEGSSHCIRAMLCLTMLHAKQNGKNHMILAGRNAHKTLLSAAALLGFEVTWLCPKQQDSYLSCKIGAAILEKHLEAAEELPAAVYLTSPDYLGNMTVLPELAAVCHKYGVLLLVDNAHGAYLKFLPQSLHPMDLGADACCDSAHKTLPALTGAAYLHISKNAPCLFAEQAKTALSLFGSTSPSYLILQSLDAVNRYLADGYRERLGCFVSEVQDMKMALLAHGYELLGNEPLKLTLKTKPYGYEGKQLAVLLRKKEIECEFADPDYIVLMLTPEIGSKGLLCLKEALCQIPRKKEISIQPPGFHMQERVLSVREAVLSEAEELPVEECIGRVLAAATVACPPAVPIAVCGERIDEAAVLCFSYYGISSCMVVKENRKNGERQQLPEQCSGETSGCVIDRSFSSGRGYWQGSCGTSKGGGRDE